MFKIVNLHFFYSKSAQIFLLYVLHKLYTVVILIPAQSASRIWIRLDVLYTSRGNNWFRIAVFRFQSALLGSCIDCGGVS